MKDPRQAAAEVAISHGIELVGEDRGIGPGLDHRQRLAPECDDIGVDGVAQAPARTGCRFGSALRLERARPDEAVAVPFGLPGAQTHAMDHAVPHEPVVALVIARKRVRADPDIPPVERGRNCAGHRQVLDRLLFPHRRVDAAKKGTVRGKAATIEFGKADDAGRCSAANGFFDDACHDGPAPPM